MFKSLYSHVNNIIDKYLQTYNHILIIFTIIIFLQKKRKKLKLKQLLNYFKFKFQN